MAPEPNFESISLNSNNYNNNFSESNQDLDANFFLGNVSLPQYWMFFTL